MGSYQIDLVPERLRGEMAQFDILDMMAKRLLSKVNVSMRVMLVKWKLQVLKNLQCLMSTCMSVSLLKTSIKDGDVIAANTVLSHEIMVKIAEGGVKQFNILFHQ